MICPSRSQEFPVLGLLSESDLVECFNRLGATVVSGFLVDPSHLERNVEVPELSGELRVGDEAPFSKPW